MNIISYARMSTKRIGATTGIRDQHELNEALAQHTGSTIIGRLTDSGVSASGARRRAGFESLVDAVDRAWFDGRSVDGIAVVHEDRAARNLGDWQRLLTALARLDRPALLCRGRLRDPRDAAYVRESTEIILQAEREILDASRRQARSHARRAALGEPPGGTRPFGWLPDRRTLDPDESPIAQQMIIDFADGTSINAITRGLRDRGVPTSRGNLWTSASVRVFLRSSRMCGWRSLRGELVLDDAGAPVQGLWQPLVAPELWRACQNRFTSPRAVAPRGPALLTGLVRCGARGSAEPCGRTLTVQRPERVSSHLYVCPGPQVGGCAGVGRNGVALEHLVTRLVTMRLDTLGLPVRVRTGSPAVQAPLLRQRSALIAAWTCGALVDADRYNSRLVEIEEAIAQHESRTTGQEGLTTAVLAAAWPGLALTARQTLLRALVRNIIVLPIGKGRRGAGDDSVVITWREQDRVLLLDQSVVTPVPIGQDTPLNPWLQ